MLTEPPDIWEAEAGPGKAKEFICEAIGNEGSMARERLSTMRHVWVVGDITASEVRV